MKHITAASMFLFQDENGGFKRINTDSLVTIETLLYSVEYHAVINILYRFLVSNYVFPVGSSD
jgi:hypothetical protein